MQIRDLTGFRRLVMAVAIASLIIAPAGAAGPVKNGKPADVTPMTSGRVDKQVDDKVARVEPILYMRSNYAWPFSSGPVYSTGGLDEGESRGSAPVLRTAVGTFDLTRGVPEFPAELTVENKLSKTTSQHFIMQVRTESFADGTFDALKRDLVAQGGSIVAEFPVSAFIVRMTAGAHAVVSNSPSIVALQPYQPAFKLSPEIGRVPLLNPTKALSNVYTLKLKLFPGESVEAVSATLATMGLHVRKSAGDMIVLDADRSKLAAIATLDSVYRIEEVLPLFLMSEETTTTIQGGKWNNGAAPYNQAGVDGGGLNKGLQTDDQILAILDSGIQLDAGDLSNTSTDPGLDINGLPIAGHRKVAFYGTTVPFGGGGDLLGCDGNTTGGVTHGHTVAAVALGNATNVAGGYGAPYRATDASGNFWGLDGVAPKARLVAYDGAVTPLTGRCDDVQQIENDFPLDSGDVDLVLADAYAKGARIVNFSWGSVNPAGFYGVDTEDIDTFLVSKADAMVFVSAGNTGRDKNTDRIPDPNTIGSPATAKNIVCVGASSNADDLGDANLPNRRWPNSSNGPATPGTLGRIAPLLMAPGTDAGTLGLASEFHCRSNDNSQFGPVECDVISGQLSSSFAAGAASGAALLVRDYFAQGFYPDGSNSNAANASELVPTISGPLVKAILVSSAEWMHLAGTNTPGLNLTRKFRGNREQGFGRILLANALPLQTYPGTVSGLIVGDGGGPGQPGTPINSTGLDLVAPYPASQSYSLNVCDTSQPLKIVIAWNDPSADADLDRDLDLEVTAPSGAKYLGNFFSDDTDDNAVIAGNEDCTYTGQPWPPNSNAGVVDTGPWSLPSATCTAGAHIDFKNNVEGVFLSSDSRNNGIYDNPSTTCDLASKVGCEAFDNQVEQGTWTVTVKNGQHVPLLGQPDNFSIAISGGVCIGSSAHIQRVLANNQLEGNVLTCNDSVVATINEIETGGDPTVGTTQIAARTILQVLDSNDAVQDTETLAAGQWTLVTTAGVAGSRKLRFDSDKVLLTDGTLPESGNGALDVRDGNRVRVVYSDAGPAAQRIGTATVSCRPVLAAGGVTFGQFGKDAFTLVDGGCEKDQRGYFTFGFPDRYMDAGELVQYLVAFQSAELGTDLVNISITLRAVLADADSPASCKPGTNSCADPNRTNNPSAAALLTVLDSPKVYGVLPSGATLTPSFTVQMANTITGTQKVDMIIGVTAKSAGKGVETLIVQREILNADAFSIYYSTDFPSGGTEPVGGFDINNNESLETVTSSPRNFTNDYFFETRSYSNMTATNPLATIKAPWNFDTDNGGFVNGLQNTSRPAGIGTYAQWGEDKNYNGLLDGFCDDGVPANPKTVPCTKDGGASESCKRCSLNPGRPCSVNSDCTFPLPNDGTCLAPIGFCNYTLDEDRDPAQGSLDTAWSTAGGCGWQTKAPGDPAGGVWHTGLIGTVDSGACLADDSTQQCERFDKTIDGDSIGDNNWWELLVTPVLHKVNTAVDGSGDPVYQVAITDWAWNMSLDIPDTNANVTLEFDTDINKVAGADLFNDAGILLTFRGKQGAISSGNAPITNGFNMFARISNCQDTDGNGALDRCGTATGKLCGANKRKPDTECYTGAGAQAGGPINAVRGLCSNPPAVKRCTGNHNLACVTDADCNQRCSGNLSRGCQVAIVKFCTLDNTFQCTTSTQCSSVGKGACTVGSTDCSTGAASATATTISCAAVGACATTSEGSCGDQTTLLGVPSPAEKCVFDPAPCITNADCGAGTCIINAGNNREGRDNCEFYGTRVPSAGTEFVKALEPYGLAAPADDDQANGYCNRNDSLNGIDKGLSCTTTQHCEASGVPYATVRSCSGLTSQLCESNADCSGVGTCTNIVYAAVCTKPNAGIDEYVQKNGPGRNYSIAVTNGPDMRFTTLEDFYGDSGTAFQAALGLNQREPDVNTTGQAAGLGLAVDDMVISWKETRLDPDSTNCAGSGECATLDTSSTISYEGTSIVSLTITDKSPYGTPAPADRNDCNDDGDYTDVGIDDQDCNNNGKLDVVAKVTSEAETTGEIAYLDQIAPGSPVYKANVPYSTLYNSPGTLFVVQSGNQVPLVTASYVDRNDGTGSVCKNNQEPEAAGFIIATTTVAATSGRITINSYGVQRVSTCTGNPAQQCVDDAVADALGECANVGTCNTAFGDNDGFADTNELANLVVVFANKSGLDVDDLTATLGTTSPNIECITRSATIVGSLANGALSDPADYLPFQFKVANVNRVNLNDTLDATFTVTVRSNKFDALTRATEIKLDLDFNASGGAGVADPNFESFESGFGKFTLEFLDKGLNTLAASDGYRCQYNDPFALNSNASGRPTCFLGFATEPATGVNDWHVHTSVASHGVGRAFTGSRSLHLGIHTNAGPAEDNTRLRHIMSVKTIAAINVGLAGASPELNFAQQVNFVDSLLVNVSPGETSQTGTVQARINDSNAVWTKLFPYENVYDQQGTDDFSNCMFDPIDDGNDEDSFFDPDDPARDHGPSSTCFPEFAFSRQGQTDYRKDFDPADIQLASDGPGLAPCNATDNGVLCLPKNTLADIKNPGTWVRPRFSLVPLAGRQIFLRFLYTAIELADTETMLTFFGRGNVVGDDGWYIDDIHVDGAVTSAINLTTDGTVIASPLSCGACTTITAKLSASPTSLAAPGQIVTINAATPGNESTANVCLNGVLQYQFWNDTNGNGLSNPSTGVGDAGDILLRDWTDNSSYVDAPTQPTDYGVRVRCSTNPACDSTSNSTVITVAVTCPTATNAAFPQTIDMTKVGGGTISWTSAVSVDAVRGILSGPLTGSATFDLKGHVSFTNTVSLCLATNSAPISSLVDAPNPAAGTATNPGCFYYLVRGQGQKYTTTAPSERGFTGFCNSPRPRDSEVTADPTPCP